MKTDEGYTIEKFRETMLEDWGRTLAVFAHGEWLMWSTGPFVDISRAELIADGIPEDLTENEQ